jgi:hypothetical protein
MRFLRRRGEREQAGEGAAETKSDPVEVYLGLRGIPLGEHGGPTEPLDGTPVIAVLLDWGQRNGSATIAAMADGATSVYTSTGGGVIGAGFHAPVREAHRRLMLAARDRLAEFASTTEAPIPAKDRMAIVIRTTHGLRRGEASSADVQNRTAPGQAVFDAANDVLTAVRITTEAQEQAWSKGPSA